LALSVERLPLTADTSVVEDGSHVELHGNRRSLFAAMAISLAFVAVGALDADVVGWVVAAMGVAGLAGGVFSIVKVCLGSR
jgi:hypothetical protein